MFRGNTPTTFDDVVFDNVIFDCSDHDNGHARTVRPIHGYQKRPRRR